MAVKIKCLSPFTDLRFHKDGEVYFCCPAWMKIGPLGNLFDNSIEEIWNGPKAQLVRKRFYEEKIKEVCNERYCPYLNSDKFFNVEKLAQESPDYRKILSALQKKETHLPFYPLMVDLADSGECNLRCKMCMSNPLFIPPNPKLSRIIFKRVLPELLPHLKYILLTGNGEPFFRQEIRELMQNLDTKKYPKLKIALLTNGLLLNRQMWRTIEHCNFSDINVSIDAATEDTYREIRGGNWQVLQKNLKLISELRKKGKFKKFQINFVVMKSNYQEMKDFVKMGFALGCDVINFQKIFGITPGCWEENINLFKNPKIFLEIKEILNDPIFKDERVLTGQITSYKNYQLNFWDKIGFYKLKRFMFEPIFRVYFWVPLKKRRQLLTILRKMLPPVLRVKITA